jgi:hypothetical protein
MKIKLQLAVFLLLAPLVKGIETADVDTNGKMLVVGCDRKINKRIGCPRLIRHDEKNFHYSTKTCGVLPENITTCDPLPCPKKYQDRHIQANFEDVNIPNNTYAHVIWEHLDSMPKDSSKIEDFGEHFKNLLEKSYQVLINGGKLSAETSDIYGLLPNNDGDLATFMKIPSLVKFTNSTEKQSVINYLEGKTKDEAFQGQHRAIEKSLTEAIKIFHGAAPHTYSCEDVPKILSEKIIRIWNLYTDLHDMMTDTKRNNFWLRKDMHPNLSYWMPYIYMFNRSYCQNSQWSSRKLALESCGFKDVAMDLVEKNDFNGRKWSHIITATKPQI